MQTYSVAAFINKKVLITGDVGSGKTRLTEKLLSEAIDQGCGKITLIDMAPPRARVSGARAGGRACIPCSRREKVRLWVPRGIARPRLDGADAIGVLRIAERNARTIEPCLLAFCKAPTEALFINDATMFLHAGAPSLLLKAVSMASTFIGNAYSGVALADDKGSGINARESEALGLLERVMDIIIRLEAHADECVRSVK